jgi:hypothetical protein
LILIVCCHRVQYLGDVGLEILDTWASLWSGGSNFCFVSKFVGQSLQVLYICQIRELAMLWEYFR